uniref:Uncharacterized protein n=1 Tax=Desulfovibrio sp. U5L TaxID=596152 RepID=I2Q1C2_9BACT
MLLVFNQHEYRNALGNGECDPPCIIRNFIPTDRIKYGSLKDGSTKLSLSQLKKRLPFDMFNELRGALGLTMKHAQTRFPAYRFLAPEFINDEWLASVDWHKKFHRDHVLHQPMCVYVGYSLLRNIKGLGRSGGSLLDAARDAFLEGEGCEYLREYMAAMGVKNIFLEKLKILPTLADNFFLEIFFLTALFHDLGYPWQFSSTINTCLDSLASINSIPSLDPVKVLQDYGQRLFIVPLKGYLNKDLTSPASWGHEFRDILDRSLRKTHGMPGAINFLYLNDQLRSYPSKVKPLHRFGVEWSAMAIMMHDMGKIYGKVESGNIKINCPQLRLSFDKDPLSFVMAITDLIQDFSRPDATFVAKPSSSSDISVNYRHRCHEVAVDWDVATKVLKIIYRYKNYKDFIANKHVFLPESQKLYFDPFYGYFSTGSLGIKRILLDAEWKP